MIDTKNCTREQLAKHMINFSQASSDIERETVTAGSIALTKAETICKEHNVDLTAVISELSGCYIDTKDNTLKCRK